MALDYNRIAERLKRHGLTENQAWDAISREYISITNNPGVYENDSAAAEHFFIGAYGWYHTAKIHPTLVERAVAEKDKILEARERATESSITEDDLYISPKQVESDIDYIVDTLKLVPIAFRIPAFCVMQSLLKHPPTKPLTPETCRRILKEHSIKNTSEYARQVFTFLTTLKVKKDA